MTKVHVTPFRIKMRLFNATSFIPLLFVQFLEKVVGAAASLLHSLTFIFVPLVSQGFPALQVQISEISCEV